MHTNTAFAPNHFYSTATCVPSSTPSSAPSSAPAKDTHTTNATCEVRILVGGRLHGEYPRHARALPANTHLVHTKHQSCTASKLTSAMQNMQGVALGFTPHERTLAIVLGALFMAASLAAVVR